MSKRNAPGPNVPELKRASGFRIPVFRRRAALYVDGLNLYHGIDELDQDHLKWVDLKALARRLAPATEAVKRVVWCSAFRPQARSKLVRHSAYADALTATGVICRMGHFIVSMDGCNACGHTWTTSSEKQGDVNLALSIAADAEDDLFDVCYLVTTDGDHAATARYLKQRFPDKVLVIVAPPGRSHNRFLLEWADFRTSITAEDLEASLFPEWVKAKNRRAKVHRPDRYAPPEPVQRGHLKLVVNND